MDPTCTLKSVRDLEDVHICPERIRSVERRIGEVLDAKPGVGVGPYIDSDADGADDLHGSAEILRAEVIFGKQSRAQSGVERHPSVPCR